MADEQDLENDFITALGEQSEEPDDPIEDAPEVEAPEAEAPEPEEVEPTVNPLESLFSQVNELGIDTEGIDSADALVARLAGQLKEQQPLARYAQQVMPYEDQIREFFQKQDAPAEQASDPQQWTKDQHFKDKYGGPTWSPAYQQLADSGQIKQDPDTGQWMAAPGYEMSVGQVINDVNAAAIHKAKFWQNLTNGNPLETIYSSIEDPVTRLVNERVEQILAEREQTNQGRTVVSSFEEANASWMYKTDAKTGQRVPSEAGQAFFNTVADLRESGITDQAKLIAVASKLHGVGQTPAAAVAQATAPSKQESFLESARQRAEHTPNARAGGADEAPQIMNDRDLDSIWERSFAASRN